MNSSFAAAFGVSLSIFLASVLSVHRAEAAEPPKGLVLFRYPDTLVNGHVSAELSVPLEECRTICSSRVGCLGFDYIQDTNACRIFSTIASARYYKGSNAETRSVIAGYRAPENPPRNWASECEAEAAPRLLGRGVEFEKVSTTTAIEVCQAASLEPSARPEIWAYYARALNRAGRYKESLHWATESANKGNAVGQWFLGVIHQFGDGITADYVDAVRLYRMAADQGYAVGQNNLGVMYKDGLGVTRDFAEAVRLFRLAADQGYARSLANLGIMYEYGRGGVAKDYSEAIRLYRLAAEQEDAAGQLHMGIMYFHGRGVRKDLSEAIRLYRLAVDQGYPQAQYNLGTLYEKGKGVAKSRAEAIRLYRLAADQGDTDARRALGLLGQ